MARWRSWFLAILLAAALIGAVVHWGEVRQWAALVKKADPAWVAVAMLLQFTTYVSVAAGWSAVLRRAGTAFAATMLLRLFTLWLPLLPGMVMIRTIRKAPPSTATE